MVRSLTSWLNGLFRLHNREAVRFAARLVGSRDNGEEIVQNAWLRLCARTDTTPIEHPRSYLFRACRNAAIDFTLRQQRERNYRVDLDSLDEAEVADNTLELYEQRRQLAVFVVSLNDLPTACRLAFVMNKYQGYSHREIAQQLGISFSMVEKHVVRALMHCRKFLTEDSEC